MKLLSANNPTLACLLMLTLSGCITANSGGGGADFRDHPAGGAPKQNVPRECQRILKTVPDPGGEAGEKFAGVSWPAIAGRYRGAWLKSSGRIVKGRECEDKQADKLAKGGG